MSLKRKILNKCLILVYVLLALLFAKFLFDYLYNEMVISKYNDRNYNVTEDMLLYANFFEPYLPYYNMGNIQYKKNQFEKAIESYEKALTYNIPEKKECSVRINLALAKLGTLGADFAQPDKLDETLSVLYSARDVLLEDGCATREGTGHSPTAEKLRKEIEKIIDELEQQRQSQEGEGGNGGGSGQSPDGNGGGDGGGDGQPSPSDPNGDNPDGGGDPNGDDPDGGDDPNGGDPDGGDPNGDNPDTPPIGGDDGDVNPGGARGAGDNEDEIRETLLQQQDEAYRERQEGLDEANNYSNWNLDDGEIW